MNETKAFKSSRNPRPPTISQLKRHNAFMRREIRRLKAFGKLREI